MRNPRATIHRTSRRVGAHLLAMVLLLGLSPHPGLAFTIVAPKNGTTLTSGEPTTAEVEAGREAGLVEVRYYWYPEQTESLVEQGDERSGKDAQSSISTEKYWQKDSITGAPVVALPALDRKSTRLNSSH